MAGVNAVLVRAPPHVGACCVGACPPPRMLGRAVSVCSGLARGVLAGWMLGLFCWFAVVSAAVRPASLGVGCLWFLPGRNRQAGLPSVFGAPPICPSRVGRAGLSSACGAPARVFLSRVSSPCRSCSLARPPPSCVCAPLGRALVFVAACCCAPPRPGPYRPSACCPLPPLCFLVSPRLPAVVAAPPPPSGYLFRSRWRLAPRFSLFPLCLVVALRCLAVCPSPLLSAPLLSSRVPSPCCSSSSVLPLPSRGFAPLGRLPAPPWFVFRACPCPAARFPVSSCCFFVFSVPLAPVCLGLFFPPRLSAFRALFALRAGAVPPPPPRAVAPGGVRCLASCCMVPRLGVGCFVRRAVFSLCRAVLVCGCLAVWCAVLLCCWLCRWPSSVGVGGDVSVGFARCSAAPCCFLRCFVLCCAVVRCCVLWCFLWCCLVSWSWPCSLCAFLVLRTCAFAPPGCAPPPPVLCVVPCVGWCCCAVLACSVLCGAVLLLAVLCRSGCGVPCCVVPCLVVPRELCGAALLFLVRLRPAACSAVLGGAVLCCRALRCSLGCCGLMLCAVLFHCLRRLKLHGQNAPKTACPRHCKKIVILGGM